MQFILTYSKWLYRFFRGWSGLRMVTVGKHAHCKEKDVQIISTLVELDEMLLRLDSAQKVSDDELRKLFPTFRMAFDVDVAADPYSNEYAAQQFALYRRIAGKDYSVNNEVSKFDIDSAVVRPFPYYTGSCQTVGNHLAAIAEVIRCLELKPGAKIAEFGPGWGNTTLTLAMMGFDVTAVDIEKNFCELIRRRAKKAGLEVQVVNADFSWIEQITEPVDAVLFFECFHHCSDHLRLIKALDKAVRDDGKVYFASEPITKDFPIPWGLRLDGESLWAIRKNGWLELGFTEEYFVQTLKKFGWGVKKNTTEALPWATVYEAKKIKKFSGKFWAKDSAIQTQTGVRNNLGLLVATDAAGFWMYGPYVKLPLGSYKATVNFTDLVILHGQVRLEVVCRGGAVVLAEEKISLEDFRASGKVSLGFNVREEESDIETRLHSDGGAAGTIVSVDIEDVR